MHQHTAVNKEGKTKYFVSVKVRVKQRRMWNSSVLTLGCTLTLALNSRCHQNSFNVTFTRFGCHTTQYEEFEKLKRHRWEENVRKCFLISQSLIASNRAKIFANYIRMKKSWSCSLSCVSNVFENHKRCEVWWIIKVCSFFKLAESHKTHNRMSLSEKLVFEFSTSWILSFYDAQLEIQVISGFHSTFHLISFRLLVSCREQASEVLVQLKSISTNNEARRKCPDNLIWKIEKSNINH